MKIDFSQLPLTDRAFSEAPMTFCETGHKNTLSSIIDLIAIETGNQKAREHWQAAQLQNLLAHAAQRSAFWRQRIGAKRNVKDVRLPFLPILTRTDVRTQVETEKSLLPDAMRTKKHSTSGSSGMPVEFFVSEMNGHYNKIRSLAQYLMEGRDLSFNKLKLKSAFVDDKNGFTVKKSASWVGGLENFVKSGGVRFIEYMHPNIPSLCDELRREPIGYLIAIPHIVEFILQHVDPVVLKEAGTEMWWCVGGYPDPQIRKRLLDANIPVAANYSSEEVGSIGHECQAITGNYHVSTSNVIVEIDTSEGIKLNDKPVGRVLVTHLHSYATPFIRYDIGDLACLEDSCPCGHKGPVLSNIHGRAKQLLKHPDGHVSPFYVRGGQIAEIAKVTEYRIRQTDLQMIAFEIESPETLTQEVLNALKNLVKALAGDDFNIQIAQVAKIDWGKDTKRLGYRSEVL